MLPSDINEYKLIIIAPMLATIGFVMDKKLDDHVFMCKSIYSIDPNKFLFDYTAKIKYATTSSLLLVGSYIEQVTKIRYYIKGNIQ